MTLLSTDSYLGFITSDTQAMVDALALEPAAIVSSCPGWDMARLCGHIGRVHRMATAVVGQQLAEPPAPNPADAPPSSTAELGQWLVNGSATLLAVLGSTPPDSPAWNFTAAPETAAFWPRRQAHETSVHRVDAQLAIGSPQPIETQFAIDGIDEFFEIYGPRVRVTHPDSSLGGTLHLHSTDGDGGEWMIALNAGVLTIEHGHGKGDAAVRGTASDLLLGLWGRFDLTDPARFELFGEHTIVQTLIDVLKG
jgi:uncharacterized protein (TIGR03083 family)